VIRVNGKVDPGSRTFRIRVMVNNDDDRRLSVGQFARVYLNIATSSNALTLPQSVVVYEGGQPRVFVYDDGQVQARPVSLGIVNGQSVEVLDGLVEGEQIVVDDPSVLSDGMVVNRRAPRAVAQAAGASTDR
jgi:multidrug efflux pump subunit AcrA (membrane-fusion protein)